MATTLPATTFAHASETIDLGDVSSLLRRRAGTIGIFMVGATIFAIIHVLLATPQFTAHGAMYLGDAGGAQPPSNADNLNFLTDYASQSDVNTQIELITAGALVQRVVLETGLNARVTPADTPPMTYWRWRFLNGGRTDAFAPGPDTVQVLYATTPGNYRLLLGKDGTYTLSTRGNWFTASRFVLHGVLGKPASGNGVQMLVEGAVPNFTPVPGKEYDVSVTLPEALAEDLAGGALAVSAGGSVTQPTKIAFLQLRWYNPYQAQAFVNQMMQDYIATQLSWKTKSASTTENFVSGQLANVSAALASADQKLASYQSKTGIVDVPQNAQSMISQLAQYETQRTTLQLQREALQQLNNEIQSSQGPLNPNPYLISQVNDTVLATLTSNLSDAETKLNQLRVQYTPYAVEVRMQNAQVERMEESIRSIVHNDLIAANKNLAGLNAIIDHLQSTIKEMPAEIAAGDLAEALHRRLGSALRAADGKRGAGAGFQGGDHHQYAGRHASDHAAVRHVAEGGDQYRIRRVGRPGGWCRPGVRPAGHVGPLRDRGAGSLGGASAGLRHRTAATEIRARNQCVRAGTTQPVL